MIQESTGTRTNIGKTVNECQRATNYINEAVQYLMRKEYMHTHGMHHTLHPETGKVCSYNQIIANKVPDQCSISFADELGRLTNGVGERIKSGTNTIVFIPKQKV